MQAELTEQHAEKHAELAADLNGMHEDLMLVDGNALIDLTEDVDVVPWAPPAKGHSGLVFALCIHAKAQLCTRCSFHKFS